MRGTYPNKSTYRVPATVSDRDSDDLDVSMASVEYILTERDSEGDEIVSFDDEDDELDLSYGESNQFLVQIPATDLTVAGVAYEEARISFPDSDNEESIVVEPFPRYVYFSAVRTDPP